MTDILLLSLLIIVVAYWWDTLRVNDIARQLCLSTCKQYQVQLLDGSVQRQRTWLRLNESRRVQLCRMYSFEFGTDGAMRYNGYLVLLGHTLGEIDMEAHRIPD